MMLIWLPAFHAEIIRKFDSDIRWDTKNCICAFLGAWQFEGHIVRI
jgi:hypothetical protein